MNGEEGGWKSGNCKCLWRFAGGAANGSSANAMTEEGSWSWVDDVGVTMEAVGDDVTGASMEDSVIVIVDTKHDAFHGTVSVSEDEIAVGTVSAGTVAAGTVAAGTVAAGTAAAGAVAVETVAAGTVAARTVVTGAVAVETMAAGTVAEGTVAVAVGDSIERGFMCF